MAVNTPYHLLSGKRIIVAGGGIAALAFVRAFTRYWPQDVQRPQVSVYERDPRQLPTGRGSYSLGLRSDSRSGGLQAIRKLGLWDEIFGARTENSEFGVSIMDNNWNTIMKAKQPTTPPDGLPVSQMRITRSDLRECLIGSISDDVEMNWANGCVSAAQLKDGQMEVRLQDGSMTECDLLIVADGASSKLRACLRPDDNLNYAGAVMIGGNAYFKPDEIPTKLKEGHGIIFGGDGHGLVVFPIDDTNFVWFVTRRSPTPRKPIKDSDDPVVQQDIIDEALREGKAFAEPFPTLIAHTDRATLKTFNAQDKPSIRHTKNPKLPCIFVGDANHAMR